MNQPFSDAHRAWCSVLPLRLVNEFIHMSSPKRSRHPKADHLLATACTDFEARLGRRHKRYVYVDGENLLYRGSTASPANVETFSQLFRQVRSEYPGRDTCVAIVCKHVRARKLHECGHDADNVLCVCCDRKLHCIAKDEIDDAALLTCAFLRARRTTAEVFVYSNDRYRWLKSPIPANMSIVSPNARSMTCRGTEHLLLCMALIFTTAVFSV